MLLFLSTTFATHMCIVICMYLLTLFWSPSITDDNVFHFSRRRNHVLKNLEVRREGTISSALTWPSIKKLYGAEKFVTISSVHGCSILPWSQFVGTRLCVDTAHLLSVGASLPPIGAAGERPDIYIKQPLGAPLLIFFVKVTS